LVAIFAIENSPQFRFEGAIRIDITAMILLAQHMKIKFSISNRRLRFALSLLGGSILILSAGLTASAAPQVVNGFGANGWYSWDTRNSSGTQLVGTNDTSPAWPGTHIAADDAAIQQQIIFMSEGQTLNDTAGGTPPAGPSGSLNGLGYVRLDGTGSNSGKSDLSYVSTTGIAAATALTDAGFGLSYRYYIQPDPTFRTLGLNISLTNSTQTNLYTFAYVQPGTETGSSAGWNTASVGASSGLFTLFANGSSAEAGAAKTLADWASDATFGSAIFGGSEEIFRVGFNIGSGQKSGLEYLDWMQTNLLNGGDVIDFQAAPEPSTWAMALVGIGLLICIRRFRRPTI
jgi:hypothetical protein